MFNLNRRANCLRIGLNASVSLKDPFNGATKQNQIGQGNIQMHCWVMQTCSKEGVLLRNVSPSLGLSDHFPGHGILNYKSNRDWSLRVCYFGGHF